MKKKKRGKIVNHSIMSRAMSVANYSRKGGRGDDSDNKITGH
jgi:hypothetical protein